MAEATPEWQEDTRSMRSNEYLLEDWVEIGKPSGAAVTLCGDEDLEPHLEALTAVTKITVQFPAFMDGRGFSVARKLRERGFAGDLLAAGDVLPDQWQFLERCGFSGLADSAVAQKAQTLPRISTVYQSTELTDISGQDAKKPD